MSNNIKFQSNKKRVKHVLSEQEKASLKEIRKLLVKKIKKAARKRTGQMKKAIGSRLFRKDKSLQIGIKKKGFYAGFYELGADNVPKDPFILPVIEENKDEIQAIIKEHLRRLSN